MKAIIGLLLLLGGLSVTWGGTFATFVYGVYLMVNDGFLTGLFVSTLGAAIVFIVGFFSAAIGAFIVEES